MPPLPNAAEEAIVVFVYGWEFYCSLCSVRFVAGSFDAKPTDSRIPGIAIFLLIFSTITSNFFRKSQLTRSDFKVTNYKMS